MQCVAPAVQMSPAFVCRIASHLLHPGLVWMSRDPSHAHTPAFQMNEEQYLIGHQSAPSEHLDGKEVNASQNRHVGLNELPPCRVLAPPGRWLDAVPPQHVADGLVRHMVTHVGQRSYDSIVSPAGILPSHFNDQRLKILPDSWPPGIPAVFGAVEFAGDQPAIPGQNGGGLSHTGALGPRPAAE